MLITDEHSHYFQMPRDSRFLHLAPTIHHQAEAILAFLRHYNWPAFSIVVSSRLPGDQDFIDALRLETSRSKQWYANKDKGSKYELMQRLHHILLLHVMIDVCNECAGLKGCRLLSQVKWL